MNLTPFIYLLKILKNKKRQHEQQSLSVSERLIAHHKVTVCKMFFCSPTNEYSNIHCFGEQTFRSYGGI